MVAEVKTMDIKKSPVTTTSNPKASISSVRKAELFLESIKSEFSKISWTSKEELLAYTKIVVLTTFIFGMGVYLVDLTIQSTLSTLSLLMRLIFG